MNNHQTVMWESLFIYITLSLSTWTSFTAAKLENLENPAARRDFETAKPG
jgi:hypothetical protein